MVWDLRFPTAPPTWSTTLCLRGRARQHGLALHLYICNFMLAWIFQKIHAGMNFFSCWHEFFYFKKFMLAWIFSEPLVLISNTIFGSPDQPKPPPHHFWGDAPLQSRLPYINSISQLLVSVGTLQSWSIVFELSFDLQYQPTLYKSRLV